MATTLEREIEVIEQPAASLPVKSSITLTVNGVEKRIEVAPWTTLLDLLP